MYTYRLFVDLLVVVMRINDLIEHFVEFSKARPSMERLSKKRHKELEMMNQEIHFRDLVIRGLPVSCGESKWHTNKYTQSTEERLNAHILSVFNLANEDHRANYCDQSPAGGFIIKNGKENHITRLTMNEFSLYTAKPLTTVEYIKLSHDIRLMAANLEPNVHVLLSSFAVTNKPGQILNMSMYLEGGTPPKIHSFAKNTASRVDINYGNQAQLFTQQTMRDTSYSADVITSEHGENVCTGSIFEARTAGGAVYTQAIDVCLDHAYGHSKEQIERRISGSAAPDEIIPAQIEQCVTSSWIDLHSKSTVADQVLHADPVRSMLAYYKKQPGTQILDEDAKKRITPAGFPQMSIQHNAGGYAVNNPPFGSHFIVEVLAERPAAKYLPAYQEPVTKHNTSVIERQLFASRQRDLSKEEKFAQGLSLASTTVERVSFRLAELKSHMLEQCRPSFWQRIFRTEEYRQKIEARQIINNSFAVMADALQTQGNSVVLIMNPWKKDLAFRLGTVGSSNADDSFKQSLRAEINQAITINLKQDLNCEFEPDKAEGKANQTFGAMS